MRAHIRSLLAENANSIKNKKKIDTSLKNYE